MLVRWLEHIYCPPTPKSQTMCIVTCSVVSFLLKIVNPSPFVSLHVHTMKSFSCECQFDLDLGWLYNIRSFNK